MPRATPRATVNVKTTKKDTRGPALKKGASKAAKDAPEAPPKVTRSKDRGVTKAPERPADKAPDKVSDKAPDKVSDKAPDKVSDAFTAAATEAAYHRVLPRMRALPAREVSAPSYHLQRAALAALQVLRYIETAKLTHCYEALAEAGLFDLSQLTGLRELALAAWFTRAQLDGARGTSTTQQVPLGLLDEAGQLRARMLRVLDFHFSDDPSVARELATIRQGHGYNDLAADLLALARLYKQHQAALLGTPRHYDKADQALAAKLADRILDHLDGGSGTDVPEWQDQQARIGVLFAGSYDEVIAAGRYLCRKDPAAAARFLSLAAAGRRSGGPVPGQGGKGGQGDKGTKKGGEPGSGDKPTP